MNVNIDDYEDKNMYKQCDDFIIRQTDLIMR